MSRALCVFLCQCLSRFASLSLFRAETAFSRSVCPSVCLASFLFLFLSFSPRLSLTTPILSPSFSRFLFSYRFNLFFSLGSHAYSPFSPANAFPLTSAHPSVSPFVLLASFSVCACATPPPPPFPTLSIPVMCLLILCDSHTCSHPHTHGGARAHTDVHTL